MKSKVFLIHKGAKSGVICTETEKEMDKYLNEGYKMVSSQIIFEGFYVYTYTVMVKE